MFLSENQVGMVVAVRTDGNWQVHLTYQATLPNAWCSRFDEAGQHHVVRVFILGRATRCCGKKQAHTHKGATVLSTHACVMNTGYL